MKFHNKKNKVVFFSIIALFFVMFVISYILFSNYIENKQIEILETRRDIAIEKINNEFIDVESVVYSLSSVIRGSDGDYSSLQDIFIDVNENHEIITQVYFGLPNNTFIISTEFTAPDGFDVRLRPWYVGAVNNGDMFFTDVYVDATEDRLVVSVSYPVYEDGTLIGVLGADLEISTITEFVNEYIDDPRGFTFLLDSNNHVIAHTNLIDSTVTLYSTQAYDIPVDVLEDNIGISERVVIQDDTGKIAYGIVNHSGFMFGIFMSDTDLRQSYQLLGIMSVSFLTILLGILIVTIYIVTVYINTPLNYLISDINAINIVKHPEFRLPIDDKSGFANARKALNDLIDEAVNNMNIANTTLEELSLEVQKFQLLLDSSTDILFMINRDKRYVEVYGDNLFVTGVDKEELLGKTHEEAFGEEFAQERNEQYDRALQGETISYAWDVEYDGVTYLFENVLTPIRNKNNEIIGAIGISRDITEKEKQYQEMLYVSTHDYLTNLSNRKVYYETLIDLSTKKAYPFTVMNLDVNGLKIINDAYGHESGDEALLKTANILKNLICKDCFVFRVSGDEFSIVMPNQTEADAEQLKAELIEAFHATYINNINLSVAIGYFTQHSDETSLDEVRRRAENDMYRQKITERKSVKNRAISAILKTLTEKYASEKKHSTHVAHLSKLFGEVLQLSSDDIKALETAALFHDIGKISIPDNILRKPGKLTTEEYEILKTHTIVGYDILHTADEYSDLAIHASSHHERYDGTGYPNGLKGKKIPLFSRIICITDAFEAMTSDRLYRKKLTLDEAINEIKENAGTQFDPELAEIFIKLVLPQL